MQVHHQPPTDLHLTPDNCSIDSKGIPVAGFTNDIDADTRSITIPDMGADEFDAYNAGVLAGIVSTAVCSNKAVVNTGTIYTDASCNLIARVLPSGVSPVTGIINTCVTMDAAQLYFNGEPYVQRHYDLEPATNPATATATITMYFTDAAFALYNATNPVWPACCWRRIISPQFNKPESYPVSWYANRRFANIYPRQLYRHQGSVNSCKCGINRKYLGSNRRCFRLQWFLCTHQ